MNKIKNLVLKKCCICKIPITSLLESNNPAPLGNKKEDRCCNRCNSNFVIPIRLSLTK